MPTRKPLLTAAATTPTSAPPMPTPADDLAQQLAAVRAYCPSPGPGRAPGPPICPTPAAGCGGWGR